MNLLTLSFKNLQRRKLRSSLTVGGVAIAAAALFSLMSFDVGFERALKQEMADSGIHMLVSTEGCPMEAASLALHGGEIPKFLDEQRLAQVREVAGIRAASGMLIFSLIEEEGKAVYFYGIDDEMRRLKPQWKIRGDWFTGPDSIILGAEAAKVEKRTVGDKVFFPGIDAEFTVSGVLERTGSEDDGFFFLPLKTAQRVFKKEGKLTAVGVSLTDIERLDAVKARIETIPDAYVVTKDQIIQQIMSLIGSSKTLMTAVLIVALAVSFFGVVNTVLMSVFEMQREFGYMRCVGASRGDIFRIVFLEALVLCLAGGVLGAGLGLLGSSGIDYWLHRVLPYAPAGRLIVFDPLIFLASILFTALVGVLAGIIPGVQAARLSPMEAVRNA
jgi:putative ABC transport system permease protein